MIFATLFQQTSSATRALAANLLGAVVGGVLEYSSMVIGIKGLYIIAGVAYGAAYYFSRGKMTNLTRHLAPETPIPDPISSAR